MNTLQIEENAIVRTTYRNASESYIIGDEEIPVGDSIFYTEKGLDLSILYKYGVRNYGRCISKCYIDDSQGKPKQIGWVFIKRDKYEDTGETYLKETWLTVERKYPVRYEGVVIA